MYFPKHQYVCDTPEYASQNKEISMTLDNLPEPVMAYLAAEEAKDGKLSPVALPKVASSMMRAGITADVR